MPLHIPMISDETWMKWAIREADLAAKQGDVPVGCVIVDHRGALLASGQNRREQEQDPTAHAEIVTLRLAAIHRGHWRLSGCTLYVTLEPCPMCAGAIVNARVERVVYGCRDPKAGAVRSIMNIADDPRLNHRVEVVEGVLAEDCAQRLRQFFGRLRREGQK
ncbi:MAG: tRNA adenosine(34) deaminase TadA [Polyangiaceae bacterium]|nr:tRNA adenosine(34) deaminase TadA [Polyangiaceae bacterium]